MRIKKGHPYVTLSDLGVLVALSPGVCGMGGPRCWGTSCGLSGSGLKALETLVHVWTQMFIIYYFISSETVSLL